MLFLLFFVVFAVFVVFVVFVVAVVAVVVVVVVVVVIRFRSIVWGSYNFPTCTFVVAIVPPTTSSAPAEKAESTCDQDFSISFLQKQHVLELRRQDRHDSCECFCLLLDRHIP